MAADRAKEDFSHILSNINRKFEVQYTKWVADSKIFDAKIRTQIPRESSDFNASCDEWVDLFSQITDTVWAKMTSNTGPKIKFRKLYRCWTGEGKVVKKDLLFDRTRCKGYLDLKVLSDNSISKRKTKHVKNGMNFVIKVTFHHLHPVDTTNPNAFFVHHCSPQQNIPTQPIQPNDRLQERIAIVVNNGPEVSRKAAEKAEQILAKRKNGKTKPITKDQTTQSVISYEGNIQRQKETNPKHRTQLTISYEGNVLQKDSQQPIILQVLRSDNRDQVEPVNLENIQQGNQQPVIMEVLGSTAPDQVEPLKLDTHLTDQHFTQYVVNAPPFDVTDQVLMYQPFVLEVPQLISLAAPNLTSQFLHIQSEGAQIL